MVSVNIYLENTHDPERLMRELLQLKLAAHASLSSGIRNLALENGRMTNFNSHLIVLQTKALLFGKISAHITKLYGRSARVFCTPITLCGPDFYETIRNETERI